MAKDLIEKLKANERGWMFLAEDEQCCMKQVNAQGGIENLRYDGDWEPGHWSCLGEGANEIFRIKPGYEPKPEYEDYEIRVASHKRLMAFDDKADVLDGPTSIHKLPCRPDFDGFYYTVGDTDHLLDLDSVARVIREGKKVVARFVKA
jgi:hypothetical protein